MKKMFVIVEGKKGVFIEVENDVLTSVYKLQKENVPIFGNSSELPNIQSDLVNRFGKVDEVYVFVRDKLYATQFCSKDEDIKEKIKDIIQKMKGNNENLKETDFAYKTHLFRNTYLSSIYKTNSINSLQNFFKDIGWGEVKYIGPLELFIFVNNVDQYKKSILMPISNGFIFFDNKKVFLSNKENLALLTKGIEEIFVTYPDPLSDNNASFNEIRKIIPQIKQGRPWLTLKGIKTKPGEGVEWGYLIYYFENSGSWREDFDFISEEKRKAFANPEENKEENKAPIRKNVSIISSSGVEIEEKEEKKPKNRLNRELAPKIKIEKKKIVRSGGKIFPVLTKDIFSGFSLKPLIISVSILIFAFVFSYFLPKILPYKEATVNIKNVSLDTLLRNQEITVLFRNEKEFYEGKFYVLNDGSKDFGTFSDKGLCLKEAFALGPQIKVFEIEKVNNVEINRTQISS